jgi:hypothetical protein
MDALPLYWTLGGADLSTVSRVVKLGGGATRATPMFSSARRMLQTSILGAILGTVIAGPWAGLAGSLLGLAAGGLQEAERRVRA